MKTVPHRCGCEFAFLAWLLIATSAAAQSGAGSQASSLRNLAAQDRAYAADARKSAQMWEDMADKARARAAASSGSFQQSWGESAQSDAADARRLNDEADQWEQKSRDLDAQADAAENQAGGTNQPAPAPSTVSNPPPAPLPPATTATTATISNAPLGEPEPASAPSQVGHEFAPGVPLGGLQPGQSPPSSGPTPAVTIAESGCSNEQDQQPIDKDDLEGDWTDDATGERVQLQTVGATVKLTGKHKWYGDWESGGLKLSFTRDPEPNEMGTAPDWARKAVYQKIKWELELEPHRNCGQLELRGKWYPGEFKWRAQSDSGGSNSQDSVLDIGRGTPIDIKYLKPPPAMARVIVLENQPEVAHGIATFGYPFRKNPVLYNTERTLFICGRGLPRNWRRPIKIEGDPDSHLEYLPVAIYKDPISGPGKEELFKQGFKTAAEDVDPIYAQDVQKLDAMIVKVQLKEKVLPGIKEFKLNGIAGSWTLQFGDQRAALRFARRVTYEIVDTTDDVFLPERVFLQARTDVPFPTDQIRLRLWVNDKEVHWAGQPTLVAYRDAKDPTLYNSQVVELVEGGAMPSKQERLDSNTWELAPGARGAYRGSSNRRLKTKISLKSDSVD